MAVAGARAPLAIGPKGVDVRGGPPTDGRVSALAGTGDSVGLEKAQEAREGAPQQRGEAQWATLLEQAEEEKKTAQQARLASIREQQAALVRWISAMRVEAKKKLAEAQLAATEGQALEEGPKQLQRESAELKGLKESAELKGLKESAELKGLKESAELRGSKESAELRRSKEKAASAEAVMVEPARPPDRLNEQFTVNSAVLVQEPG